MANDPSFPVKKLVPLTAEMAKQIADFRFDARLPSETEAIRQLIKLGLSAARNSRDENPKKKATGHPKDTAETADNGRDDDEAGEAKTSEVGAVVPDEAEK